MASKWLCRNAAYICLFWSRNLQYLYYNCGKLRPPYHHKHIIQSIHIHYLSGIVNCQYCIVQSCMTAMVIISIASKGIPDSKFMGPTWGPPGSCRPQMGPMLAPWILLSGMIPTGQIFILLSPWVIHVIHYIILVEQSANAAPFKIALPRVFL